MNSAPIWRAKAAASLALGLYLLAGVTLPVDRINAQTRSEVPTIVVPQAIQIAAGAQSALPLRVTPETAIPRRAIVLIRGLPSTVSLSGGRLFESGIWGIAAVDVEQVSISSASTTTGRSELAISLVAIDGTLLAEARSSLVIGGAGAIAATGKTDPTDKTLYTAATPQEGLAGFPTSPAAPAPAKRLSPAQSEQLTGLMRKGDQQMSVGNVSAARLLYQHAADSGLAAAALALAASYDEVELQKLPAVRGGGLADPKQARAWYEKANELGSTEARARLQRLGSR
jgi:hypothetical protein